MDLIRTIRLRWWHGSFHVLPSELSRAQFAATAPPPWQPALNAYLFKQWCSCCIGLTILFAVTGCSSFDNDTIGAPGKTPVPGEVNPDAPDAAQSMRTSPGWNF